MTNYKSQCNCDAGAEAWTEDSGHLTDKRHLPVTKLNFGNLDKEGQEARLELGPLYCTGQEEVVETAGSCRGLWSEANVVTGYHMVRG